MADSEQQHEKSVPAETAVAPEVPKETGDAQNDQIAPIPAIAVAPAAASPPAPPAPAAPTAPTPSAPETPVARETKPPAAEFAEPTEPAKPVETTPIEQLWSLAKASGHPEIWGVTLADPENHVPTRIILQKYLNANDGDLPKAKDQLTKTLEWRAKTKPLELVKKAFSKTKFDGLGYVTTYAQEGSTEPEGREVFTWNIYGGAKSIEETFGNLEE